MNRRTRHAIVGLVALVVGPAAAAAQGDGRGVFIEARGGFNVPTFDITDAAKPGPSLGAGIGVRVADRITLLGEADFGFHPGADLPVGGSGPDVNVYHFIAKLGYDVVRDDASPWGVMVNAGAGALVFDVDAPGSSANTYVAINVGAKITYAVSPNVDFVISPQGDIAFTDSAVLGTSNAWVWPFSAGLRLNF